MEYTLAGISLMIGISSIVFNYTVYEIKNSKRNQTLNYTLRSQSLQNKLKKSVIKKQIKIS
jgi:hypothetical protein